ncbi:hypothetical protein [Devosia riboflavina]|uniref:hypothetical protein n=1 Tax=Devosia riboflavina TaxID=46914 RepID=UPI000AD02DC7|nr:hypothetical protein [Devosia riboflavina]
MPIEIKLNNAERIRRAKLANPAITEQEMVSTLGVTAGQVKAALAYKNPGQKPGRKRA